ncbi:MAG TPA: hypothetical protein VIM73_12505, partial [Polyangiaceae bacterium]
ACIMQSAIAGNTRAGLEAGMATEAIASPYGVEHLSDTELIAGTRGLVARSNQHLARLLAHLTRLVRQLDPLPAVPARIEPLGPTPAVTSANNASWEAYNHALNPVRDLPPEHCPNNWLPLGEDSAPGTQTCEPTKSSGAPERAPSLPVQRYAVQFTACQEYVDLLERGRDLLSHAVPDRSLAEVHLRAMRLLVAELEKRKFAVSGETRRRGARGKNDAAVSVGTKEPCWPTNRDGPARRAGPKSTSAK